MRQRKAAQRWEGYPNVAARLQLAAKPGYSRVWIGHVLYDVIQNYEVVGSLGDLVVARAVDGDRVELVHGSEIGVVEVIAPNIRAGVMTGWKPFFGERRRAVAAADVENPRSRRDEPVANVAEFHRAMGHC